MVLVDTSILVSYLRGDKNQAVEKFHDVLNRKIPHGFSIFTYQEILQGAASEREFKTLREYFDTQTLYFLKNTQDSYANAAKLFFLCRKAGFTIRSTLDCLIAQTALERELHILHNDRDFEVLRKVEPALKTF